MVTRQSMIGNLTDDKMEVADCGYQGGNWYIKPPLPHQARTAKETKKMDGARAHHKTVSKRLKTLNVSEEISSQLATSFFVLQSSVCHRITQL